MGITKISLMIVLTQNINNIFYALEVLQYIIDNDDDINLNFAEQGSQELDKGSTKDIMMRVKRTLEIGIFGFKNQLPEDIQDEAFESKEMSLQNYLGKNSSLSTNPNVVPYFEVVDKLIANISKLNETMFQKEEKSKSEIKGLKRKIKYKDKNIETLEKQLAQLQQKSTHPIFDQYNQIVNQNEKVGFSLLILCLVAERK